MSRVKVWLAIGLLAAAVSVVYASSFGGMFLFDDYTYISVNPDLHKLWPLGEAIYNLSARMRPLTDLTMAINWKLGGADPVGFHAVNFAIHLAAAMALFGVMRRTLLTPRLVDRFGRHATGLALAVALLWAVHPLLTSAVTYIVQRAESLMGLFYLLTMYCVIRAFQSEPRPSGSGPTTLPGDSSIGSPSLPLRPEKGDRHRRKASESVPFFWSIAAVACCLLGMASKQVMATAPLVALVYARLFLADSWREVIRARWSLWIGLAACWILPLVLVMAFPTGKTAGFSNPELTISDYVRQQITIVPYYLRLSFWPDSLCLCYSIDFPTTDGAGFNALAALLVGLLGLTAWGVLRSRPAAFAGVWFFVILAPSSSIIPIADPIFEHRMYLSLAAVAAIVVLAGYALLQRGAGPARNGARPSLTILGGAIVAIAAGVLGYLTIERNRLYHDDYAMWMDAYAKRPNNVMACTNIGKILSDHHQRRQAIEWYEKAVAKQPGNSTALRNLAYEYTETKNYDRAAKLLRQAMPILTKPDDIIATHFALGKALTFGGQYDQAAAEFQKAYMMKPSAEFVAWQSQPLAGQGRFEQALQRLDEALRQDPKLVMAHEMYATILVQMGRAGEAIARYRQALDLEPDSKVVLNNLAGMLASCPDEKYRNGPEALKLALKANEVTEYRDADLVDTLASAYAECGQFDKAIATENKAIEMARADHDDQSVWEFTDRLNLYRAGKPYRSKALLPTLPATTRTQGL